MEINSALGETLRSRRLSIGLTQQQLAESAGVSERLIRQVETGKTGMQVNKLQAICDVLGFDLRLVDAYSPPSRTVGIPLTGTRGVPAEANHVGL